MLKFIKYTDPKIRSNGSKRKRADYLCDCGDIYNADWSSVNSGQTYRCMKCARLAFSSKKRKGFDTSTVIYRKWQDMKKRCYNKNVDRYDVYGGRGIVVCDEWKSSYGSFYNWSINNGYEDGLSLERIDVNGNYCPENCCYITLKEQKYNLVNSIYFYYKGKEYNLSRFKDENNLTLNVKCSIRKAIIKGKCIPSLLLKKGYNIDNMVLTESKRA